MVFIKNELRNAIEAVKPALSKDIMFCGQNAGNTMRNTLSSFISHSII